MGTIMAIANDTRTMTETHIRKHQLLSHHWFSGDRKRNVTIKQMSILNAVLLTTDFKMTWNIMKYVMLIYQQRHAGIRPSLMQEHECL